jgi:hypothetical protein
MTKRILQLSLSLCLLTSTVWAATDPFAGNWKLDPSKSKLTDQMKVEAAGPNRYGLIFSGGDPETITADGTDQPAHYGTTFSITVESPDRWKAVRKSGSRIIIVGIWTLSADGKTLDDDYTDYQADGSTAHKLHYVYARTTPGTGFVGTWESISEQVDSVFEIQIQPYESDGLSIVNPSQKIVENLKFDGKDYAIQGANLPAGYTCSGHRQSGRSYQMTHKLNGKLIDTRQVEVSPDRKILTMTITIPGQAKPNIQVFNRE